jgi:hypothetical protein
VSKFETVEIPFKIIGNKLFLGMYDVKRLHLEDFVEQFKHCFDSIEPTYKGLFGYFYYPEGKPRT